MFAVRIPAAFFSSFAWAMLCNGWYLASRAALLIFFAVKVFCCCCCFSHLPKLHWISGPLFTLETTACTLPCYNIWELLWYFVAVVLNQWSLTLLGGDPPLEKHCFIGIDRWNYKMSILDIWVCLSVFCTSAQTTTTRWQSDTCCYLRLISSGSCPAGDCWHGHLRTVETLRGCLTCRALHYTTQRNTQAAAESVDVWPAKSPAPLRQWLKVDVGDKLFGIVFSFHHSAESLWDTWDKIPFCAVALCGWRQWCLHL